MKLVHFVRSLALALLFVVCSATISAAEMPGEAHVYKQVDGRELKLYVFKPADWKAGGQRPAIVFFHGGGWSGGGPISFVRQSEYLAARGMVAISVQYRLVEKDAPVAPFICMQDAKSAMRWVRMHVKELGVDPARIAAGGGSAGGHLASFAAMVPGYDDPADDLNVSPKPAALVLFNPFVGFKTEMANDSRATNRFGPKTKEFIASTPANHVSKDAPPMVILHGEDDTTVPLTQVKSFSDDLTKAGARCELIVYPGETHSFFNRGKAYYQTVIAMDKFLGSLGWLKGPPTMTVPADAEAGKAAPKGKKKKG